MGTTSAVWLVTAAHDLYIAPQFNIPAQYDFGDMQHIPHQSDPI